MKRRKNKPTEKGEKKKLLKMKERKKTKPIENERENKNKTY